MADRLKDINVAIIATDMFEEVELTEPREALESEGARTTLISPKAGKITAAKHFDKSKEYDVDRLLNTVSPDEFDALLLPGGAINADSLRVVPEAQQFVRAFDAAGKPMAVICHAPWLMVSAGLVQGRVMTSFHTIADDIRNAGATWLDVPVVQDGNWVTSRQPSDIPRFNETMIDLFEALCGDESTATSFQARSSFAFGERLKKPTDEA